MVDHAKIARAQAIAQSGAIELVELQVVSILDKSVRAYFEGKLQDRDAAVAIASIAELRALSSKMRNAVVRGTMEGAKLTGNDANG